jgi:hypothetical protein
VKWPREFFGQRDALDVMCESVQHKFEQNYKF